MADAKSLFSDFLDQISESLAWNKLPKLLGLGALLKIRNDLRRKNLYDTEDPPLESVPDPDSNDIPEQARNYRTFDGSHNDLKYPRMGAVGARFGRNFPLEEVHPDTANLMSPSPRVVSRELLTRETFQPAEILNLLAAAWIQFQVHDWFAHKPGTPDDAHEIPLEPGDPWPHGPMRVPKTPAETPGPDSVGGPPTFANENSHWWDGSQVYGSDDSSAALLRTGFDGKMKIGDTALLPLDVDGVELTGFSENWWVGLSLLHALFVAEHNTICDRLKLEQPTWTDEQLFQHGRLINSALMAKIHTVEWTPAILPHPTVTAAMQINWSGFAGDELQDVFQFLDDSEVLGGIVGSKPDHHKAPYSLTEEFVSVYRMHPLLPDDFEVRELSSDRLLGRHTLTDFSLGQTRQIMERYALDDLFYSFGVVHPGALRLHNFPRHLQSLTKKDGSSIDLAAIDILRDRERGVPRYNRFRQLLRMDRVKTFEELSDNPIWVEQLRRVYEGDIDQVDLMVGLFAEPLLPGFGFSETAFRIFILMASRRLKSDRFFTSSYNEQVYTKAGLQWIRDNSMITVLMRHHPSLQSCLRGVKNAFQPWERTPAAWHQ